MIASDLLVFTFLHGYKQCPLFSLTSFNAWSFKCSKSKRVRLSPTPSSLLVSSTAIAVKADAECLVCRWILFTSYTVVYLYLVNYGRSRPEEIQYAIAGFLSVSHLFSIVLALFPNPLKRICSLSSLDLSRFHQDCSDRNPLIRALAIRTMSSIPLPSITTSLIDPLRNALTDSDPYVRKTAAISVGKLYSNEIGRKVVENEGFVANLRDLLADSNPTVVANTVASLVEISDRSDDIMLRLNVTVAGKLVAALGECSE